MHHRLVVFLVATILLCTAGASLAEPDRTDTMKRIEMLRIWRLTEMLKLSAEDGARLFPVLQRYDQEFRAKGNAKADLTDQVKKELDKPQPDAARLTDLSERILDIDQQTMEIRKKLFEELKTVLTPEQLGRYMLFEIDFRHEIDDIVNQVRHDRGRPPKSKKPAAPTPAPTPSGQ